MASFRACGCLPTVYRTHHPLLPLICFLAPLGWICLMSPHPTRLLSQLLLPVCQMSVILGILGHLTRALFSLCAMAPPLIGLLSMCGPPGDEFTLSQTGCGSASQLSPVCPVLKTAWVPGGHACGWRKGIFFSRHPRAPYAEVGASSHTQSSCSVSPQVSTASGTQHDEDKLH